MLKLILRILHKRYTWYQIERAMNVLRYTESEIPNPLENEYQWP